MDTEILQGEIENLQEAVLAIDEKVDEIEEEAVDDGEENEEASSDNLDIGLLIGRLEGEINECRSLIAAQQQEIADLRLQSSTALALSAATATEEPEETSSEVQEVIPETEEEPSEDEDAPESSRSLNWLEKLLLIR